MNFWSRRATIVDSERSYDVVFSANHLKPQKVNRFTTYPRTNAAFTYGNSNTRLGLRRLVNPEALVRGANHDYLTPHDFRGSIAFPISHEIGYSNIAVQNIVTRVGGGVRNEADDPVNGVRGHNKNSGPSAMPSGPATLTARSWLATMELPVTPTSGGG